MKRCCGWGGGGWGWERGEDKKFHSTSGIAGGFGAAGVGLTDYSSGSCEPAHSHHLSMSD